MTKDKVLALMDAKVDQMTNKHSAAKTWKEKEYFLGMAVAWDNAKRLVKEKLTKI